MLGSFTAYRAVMLVNPHIWRISPECTVTWEKGGEVGRGGERGERGREGVAEGTSLTRMTFSISLEGHQ